MCVWAAVMLPVFAQVSAGLLMHRICAVQCWGAQSRQLLAQGQGWELAHRGDLLALGLPGGSDSQGHGGKGN